MPRLIVRNAARIVTMDAQRREIADGDILIEDGVIRVGRPAPAAGEARGDRRPRLRGDAGARQHPPPPLPDPDPGGAGRAGRAALRLAEDALPDLGADAARGHVRLGAARARRAGALGLHDELGPPLPLPERRAARGHHRGGGDDRHPLPPDPRRDERRRERRRAAAGQPRRGGGRHPRRHGAGGRRLPRSAPGGDGAGRAGAVLAVLGLDRADARRRASWRATRG